MLPKVQPAHIGTIAEGLGLAPEEYDLYGTTQAKVCAKRLLEHLLAPTTVLSVADDYG
jgi:formyltetrahydrofolate synthetase